MKLASKNIVYGLLILFFLAAAYSALLSTAQEIKELSLSDLVAKVNNEEVQEIVVEGSDLKITAKDGTHYISKKEDA